MAEDNSSNEARFKAGWKGGIWFKNIIKHPIMPFVDAISAANRQMRGEKTFKIIPVVKNKMN